MEAPGPSGGSSISPEVASLSRRQSSVTFADVGVRQRIARGSQSADGGIGTGSVALGKAFSPRRRSQQDGANGAVTALAALGPLAAGDGGMLPAMGRRERAVGGSFRESDPASGEGAGLSRVDEGSLGPSSPVRSRSPNPGGRQEPLTRRKSLADRSALPVPTSWHSYLRGL